MIKKRTFTDGLPLLRSADRLEMMDGIDCHRCARQSSNPGLPAFVSLRQSSPDSGFTQKPRTGSRRWLFSFVHSLKFHLARSQMKKAPRA
jgi:hypothetical protein